MKNFKAKYGNIRLGNKSFKNNPAGPCFHRDKIIAQVNDLRLPGGARNGGGPAGQHGRAEHVGRARDGAAAGTAQVDRGAAEPLGLGDDVAAL